MYSLIVVVVGNKLTFHHRYEDAAGHEEKYYYATNENLFQKMKTTFQVENRGGVKTERVFPGLSVLRKNNKMEVLSPEK